MIRNRLTRNNFRCNRVFGHYGIEQMAAIHGSPLNYDTCVPLLFAGPGIEAQTVSRRVGPQDLAPTLAAYLGTKPPSGSVGQVLSEVVD